MSLSPSPTWPSGWLVRRGDPNVEITGTLEHLPCCALVSSATLDGAGHIAVEYAGESKLYWEDQRPVRQDGRLVFIDENGQEVWEDEVAIRLADGSIVSLARLPQAAESGS
jgi:hypothetical protein